MEEKINRFSTSIQYQVSNPDYDYIDGTSKYVALALTQNMPKYYTL